MSSQLSVAQILANLETQIAEHRAKEAFHAQQEVLHREQRAVHAGELEAMIRHYEAFKATAEAAAEIAARVAPPAPPPPPKEEPLPAKALRSKLVARVVMSMPEGEAFKPSGVAAEVNRRFGKALKKPVDSRLASSALLRMLADGRIRLVQRGTAHRESVYTRGPSPGPARTDLP